MVMVDDSVLESLSAVNEMLAMQLMMREEQDSLMNGEQQRKIRAELDPLLDNGNEARAAEETSFEDLW